MTSSTYPQQLHAIALLAAVIRVQHLNHERRNERLHILRALIAAFLVQPGHFDREMTGLNISSHEHLKALYELAVEGQDHEDHTQVKSRLRLVEETCAYLTTEYTKAETEAREKRMSEARYARMQYQAQQAEEANEAADGDTLTSDPSPWASALDEIENGTDDTLPSEGDIED